MRSLRLPPRRPADPLPRHAFPGLGDAHAACARRLCRASDLPRRKCRATHEGLQPFRRRFAEPLAVTLHAVAQAPVYGSRVLIIGAGPIGTLLVLAARFAGAREIVVTDVQDKPLDYAAKAGADRTINVARHADGMNVYAAGKGYFDVIFEAAGQGATVASALHFIKPRGTLVTVGQGATTELSVSMIVTKEIALKGSFRFDTEFALAVDLI
ncbi:MAG: hypothetical protein E5W38_32235, partial [Mesorhizobium sp.]